MHVCMARSRVGVSTDSRTADEVNSCAMPSAMPILLGFPHKDLFEKRPKRGYSITSLLPFVWHTEKNLLDTPLARMVLHLKKARGRGIAPKLSLPSSKTPYHGIRGLAKIVSYLSCFNEMSPQAFWLTNQ